MEPRVVPDPPAFPRYQEPVMAATTIVSMVASILILLRSFGVGISDDQYNAIINAVAIIGPVVAGLWARRRVTPV
jgi:hypothetical protein